MKRKYLTAFKKGDKVQHKQCPSMKGVFVRYSKPYGPFPTHITSFFVTDGRMKVRRVWWTVNNLPLALEEWTWEWAMEAAT